MNRATMMLDAELLLRILFAGLLCGLLGWERQTAGKPAGFRTLLMVGVAACLFVVAGEAAALTYPVTSSLRVEPFALIQAVAVGIGFLGSGVVVLSRDGSRVLGLTTAASIWATAAIGLTVGFGRYLLAGGTTIIVLVTLRLLRRLDTAHPHE